MKTRIREIRTELAWSQELLAEKTGVSRQTMNAIENDRYDPMLSLAIRIAKVFGKSVEEVFQPDADQRTATSTSSGTP